MIVIKTVNLNNGIEMPVLGLGLYKTLNLNEMQFSINYALEAGYRSFDTAQMYENEDLLGQALNKSGISREEIFITTKVDIHNMGYELTVKSFEDSLSRLQTDYIDLFLIHWPGQQKERLLDTWRGLEDLYKAKKVRSIGVCNCLPKHLKWIEELGEIMPAVNQIERHPLLNQNGVYDNFKDIKLEAWGPLIRGNFDLPELKHLSIKYSKTPAQIILRWDVQSGYIIIPKSANRERINENANIFDFNLDEEDMLLLDSLNNGLRTSKDPDTYDF